MPIETTEQFELKFEKLPTTIQRKLDRAIWLLNNNFRHPGLHSHPVKSHPGIYEAYVDDKYRMTFERRGDLFIMRNVDNHDECLKNP